ncbi:hypothetical protein P152DRAFT_461171 [Eremomyces bilateralis CBS 781.70]|uniref:Uncharacterized protein n=1 Tax=Eremomyces bilateralis CBS 781.70 TaxID=1392243 RepID=A0A6G1FVQ2_9PEZI|nr:uncharacterized protein P152DRAFT_461171 [Eremomyces bilateralis CBS 781.70]KAF1809786.1 hypothetical protein P152DRAFT_461171 [Eremomyces bilateralis CBS 781.70]
MAPPGTTLPKTPPSRQPSSALTFFSSPSRPSQSQSPRPPSRTTSRGYSTFGPAANRPPSTTSDRTLELSEQADDPDNPPGMPPHMHIVPAAYGRPTGRWHLIVLVPLWFTQFTLTTAFTAWMAVQHSLTRERRDPTFWDNFPTILLILAALCLLTLILAEIILFSRSLLFPRTFTRLQWAKLFASLAGWMVLFIVALVLEHGSALDIVKGLVVVLGMQLPWLAGLAYAAFVEWRASKQDPVLVYDGARVKDVEDGDPEQESIPEEQAAEDAPLLRAVTR